MTLEMLPPWFDRLDSATVSTNSVVCCGLDPDVSRMPAGIEQNEEGVFEFLSTVIELTGNHVCAYKIQKAYYDIYPCGMLLLQRVVAKIRSIAPGACIILDSKTGDIAHTMDTYLATYFAIGVDSIVLNPYMGSDVWCGLKNYPSCAGLVVVRSSNPASAEIQEAVLADGRPFWQHVLCVLLSAHETVVPNLLPIIAADADIRTRSIRALIPDDMPVLVAGYGAQGALAEATKPFLNSRRRGILVNSSRALLYPYDRSDVGWQSRILDATLQMKEDLNYVRAQ